MTNLKRTLVTTSLITTAALSVGCAASRLASFASKAGKAGKMASLAKTSKVGSFSKASRVAVAGQGAELPLIYQPLQIGKASKVGSLDKVSKVAAPARRSMGLTEALQSPQARVIHSVGGIDKFVPDEVTDAFVVTAEDEAAFASIYGRLPTAAEFSNLKSQASLAASTTDKSQKVSRAGGGIEDFVSYLDKSPSKNIIVIGHNKGGNFHFANGQSMPLAEMARLINARNKRGIFLSCEANKYVPKGNPASTIKLTHDDALDILDDLSEKLRNEAARSSRQVDDIASAGDDTQLLGEDYVPNKLFDIQDERVSELIQGTIYSAERGVKVNRTVKRVAKAGVGGGSTYYVVKLTAKREDRKRSRSNSRLRRLTAIKVMP